MMELRRAIIIPAQLGGVSKMVQRPANRIGVGVLPLLYRATSPVLADGYCLETRELWGEDGRLVAINHQTIVVIA